MSQFDHGKHPQYDDGRMMPHTKRLDAQRTPKNLEARIKSYEDTKRSLKAGEEKGYNKPGSQQKRSK